MQIGRDFLLLCSLIVSPRALGLQTVSLKPRVGPWTTPMQRTLAPTFRHGATPEVVEEGTVSNKEWTTKRLHNTQAFRSATILGALLIAGVSSKSPFASLPNTSAAILHTLSFATWFGTVAYTTFVAGITMFKNLPRKTFGKLQSKLFPKYFSLCSVTLILQIVTLKSLSVATKKSQQALVVSLAMTLLNQFVLEPKSTDNMLERYRLEDAGQDQSDQYKQLKASFGKFHGLSSLTNLIALLGGVAHAAYLGSALAL